MKIINFRPPWSGCCWCQLEKLLKIRRLFYFILEHLTSIDNSHFFWFDSSQTREVRITTSTQIKSLDVFFNDNSHSLENWLTRKSPHWCSTFNRQNKFNHLLAKTMLLCTQMRMCVCNSSAQCVTTNGGVAILNLRQHILHMRFECHCYFEQLVFSACSTTPLLLMRMHLTNSTKPNFSCRIKSDSHFTWKGTEWHQPGCMGQV